jgi:hypothetical protein
VISVISQKKFICSFCSCADDSGNWGHGGMFDALAKLSASIPDAYQQATEFRDLHLGDLHLRRINGQLLCTLYLIFDCLLPKSALDCFFLKIYIYIYFTSCSGIDYRKLLTMFYPEV